MGVHGLWKLIEPSGKPVPLETLQNKVLAVDVSIWLHQAIKGFQDAHGGSVPNAHLLGIYHRICKLLYFKIKPVFVFDGGVPVLKQETIAKRNQLRSKNLTDAKRMQKQLLNTLLKHSAVTKVLSERTKKSLPVDPKAVQQNNDHDDIFKLPPSQLDSTISSSEEDEDYSSESSPTKHWDLHNVDVKSKEFLSLPADVRHEILTDLKETRKQSSWGRIHELPQQSDEFSDYQMKRLMKRFAVQTSLEEAEKEMGGHSLSLGELESIMKDSGVILDSVGSKLASDENTRYLYIKDVKKQLEKARAEKAKLETVVETEVSEETVKPDIETVIEIAKISTEEVVKPDIEIDDNLQNDVEYQKELELAIQLSLEVNVPSTSQAALKNDTSPTKSSYFDNPSTSKPIQIDVSPSKSDTSPTKTLSCSNRNLDKFYSTAKNYIEYSGLTVSDFDRILKQSNEIHKHQTEVKDNAVTSTGTNIILDKPQAIDITESVDASESDSNDFEEVTDNVIENIELPKSKSLVADQNNAVTSSDSDDGDDFEEVPETKKQEETPKFEIVFTPSETLEDDIFKDIFAEESKSTELETITKASPAEVVEKEAISKEVEFPNEITSSKAKENAVIDVSDAKENTEVDVTAVEQSNDISTSTEELPVVNSLFEKLGKKSTEDITESDLQQLQASLVQEKGDLITERSNKERLAGNITEQIRQEAQELLRLFGIPYIVAPMEAEAQCAFLNEANLTDGTITDDSDIWLFGGKTVYKNFFNQQKRVLEYRAENIEHNFKLSRQQLVLLSLLVGSDYTAGIQGIGPVTALEVLAAFPPTIQNQTSSYEEIMSGLVNFRTWFNRGRVVGPGKAALRNKLKNIQFLDNFPSLNVIRAYFEPDVDTNRESFTWGRPDFHRLVLYAAKKFGWTQKKSEEILQPVIKQMAESKVQATMRDYFKTKHKIDSPDLTDKLSKRVKKAVDKIGNGGEDVEEEEPVTSRKRKRSAKKLDVEKEPLIEDEDVKLLNITKKYSRKKVKEIEESAKAQLEQPKKPVIDLHKKEVIPQREKTKNELLRNKLKAVEIFRKSKQGPGYVKKRAKVVRKPKEDAELSESSSDE